MWQATDDNMAYAHCMLDTKGYKYTRTGCVILITFRPQQWLPERATLLRFTYIDCLVLVLFPVLIFIFINFLIILLLNYLPFLL